MQINYDQIIEKAKQRKDMLMAIQKRLEHLNHHVAALTDARDYFHQLDRLNTDLDTEGRGLLGEVHTQLWEVARGIASSLDHYLTRYNGTTERSRSIPKLLDLLNPPTPKEN